MLNKIDKKEIHGLVTPLKLQFQSANKPKENEMQLYRYIRKKNKITDAIPEIHLVNPNNLKGTTSQ